MRIAKMPAIKFRCGRDHCYGPGCWAIGIGWHKDPSPSEGEVIYRRWLVLRFAFRLLLDRNFGKGAF